MNLAQKYDDTRRTFYAHSSAIKANDVSEDGEFKGHAAVFGNVDQGGDMIIEGAFANTLRSNRKVRVLWNHSSADPIGHPVQMQEDNVGLFVRGKLNQEVQRGREARALLKSGDIDGMSIGFQVAKNGAEFDEDTGIFKLKELKLREFSIVTFPMNELAITTGIKSERAAIDSVRKFEEFLLDTTTFTKNQCVAIASCGFKSANLGEPGAGDSDNSGDPGLDFEAAQAAIKKLSGPVFRRAAII